MSISRVPPTRRCTSLQILTLVCLVSLASVLRPAQGDEHGGYRFLVETPLIPPDFDQVTIERVWEVWPENLRKNAAMVSKDDRLQMIFARYGLSPRPDNPHNPLQYVVDAQGNWTMNCFACHGGKVDNVVIPGAPNHDFDLQTLTEETRKLKLRLGKPLARMDIGSIFVPLGSTRGTTNAVMFGVALMHFRDPQLNVVDPPGRPELVHHDMDAPPWWHFHLRPQIYIDGFAHRSHRALMQFALVRENGPEWFKKFEPAFEDVERYLLSLRAPKNPHPIDGDLAAQGRLLFDEHCAKCHGTYGNEIKYPSQRVPLAEVGTDPVRLNALTRANRESYHNSWFSDFGNEPTETEPDGYVAPPLTGIWASAPYFHNGSVPTLWHVLHPSERPLLWKRQTVTYDSERVGLAFTPLEKIPSSEWDISERRKYFDTRTVGKSAAGHEYPNLLTEMEKASVLEYLKTL
jgi:mono/diheme cytochrome c family protein